MWLMMWTSQMIHHRAHGEHGEKPFKIFFPVKNSTRIMQMDKLREENQEKFAAFALNFVVVKVNQ